MTAFGPGDGEISDVEAWDVIIAGAINAGADENDIIDAGASVEEVDSASDSPYIRD